MSDFQEPIHQTTAETPRWVGLAVALLGGVSLVGVGLGWSAINKTQGIQEQTAASVKASNDAIQQRLAKEEEINQQLESDLKVVTDKLNLTQTQLVSARKANKATTVEVDKKLTGLETSVNTQLATKANVDDVNKLNGDVSGVRSDLDATNNSIQMARSEMGTLIARNHDEIDQLRRMGQRDYYEFSGYAQERRGARRLDHGRAEGHEHEEEPVHDQRAGRRQELRKEESLGQRADLLLHRRQQGSSGARGQQSEQDHGVGLPERAEVGWNGLGERYGDGSVRYFALANGTRDVPAYLGSTPGRASREPSLFFWDCPCVRCTDELTFLNVYGTNGTFLLVTIGLKAF